MTESGLVRVGAMLAGVLLGGGAWATPGAQP